MREVLVREPDANAAHQRGLDEMTAGRNEAALGNTETALGHFDAANGYYGEAIGYVDNWSRAYSTDAHVQRGRIKRDSGFTDTRMGLVTRNPRDLLGAHNAIRDALLETGGYISGEEAVNFIEAGAHGTPKQQRRELFSEHTATLAVLSRNATAAEVLYDTIEETIPREDRDAWRKLLGAVGTTHLHGWAHQLGGRGTNGYYDTSNSVSNAVQEMARGRRVHAGVAMGRALASVSWTLISDIRNFPAAAGSITSRLPAFISQEAARESILKRP
jgi:hypothetical protein